MPKIILMNIGTEHAFDHGFGVSHPLARSAWRNTWFADEGDIVVSPLKIDKDFLLYIGHTLGFDSETLSLIILNELITDELLLSTDFISSLQPLISNSNSWAIFPCFYTPGIAELGSLLGIRSYGCSHFAMQRGCDLLNRKSHFRQLASGINIPLAPGSVVHTSQALAKAIKTHLAQTGTVIVKKDNAAGGSGNIILTRGEVKALPGARETWYVNDNIQAVAANLWLQLTDLQSQCLVVESYYSASHRFYFEYWIDDNGSPVFQNSGTIRLRPDSDPEAKELVWVGLDIPADLPPFSFANTLTMSAQFAIRAVQIGYRGPINIDAIVTDSGEVIFNESNARWGGGSVLHALGERLLGKRYADNYVLSSIRDVKCPLKTQVLDILQEQNLLFSLSTRQGIIVLSYDDFQKDTMECLVIGHSHSHVRRLESLLRESVEQ